MKLQLFAFVRRARRPEAAATPVEAEQAVVAMMELDAAAAPAEKRRSRPSGSAAAPWKPTLGAISEDGAAVPSTAASKAKAKAREKSKERARAPPPRAAARARADYDDFRHFGAPTVLPAFAPTAFLF
ncbi:hypothetical protein GUJ93_ZPchr0013g36041 [Zizania palustris]|uniref:Uncharacterized protein n=1 Tax=Zizania palustris TaxID=103762 RepID=A0A8J6BZ72_ZIZPA|nr:hypothetical protein GUJ93_ZPchr0013g36041 [Zizania palustris]